MSFLPERVVCVTARENSYGSCDQVRPKMVGQIYTVVGVEVNFDHTRIGFAELPGEIFNSVAFEPFGWGVLLRTWIRMTLGRQER